MNNNERITRVKVVNEIIKEISKHDRRFFYCSTTGKVAELTIDEVTGKIWYWNEYYGKSPIYSERICLSIPEWRRPKGWQHGGTLLALIRDFCAFIKIGNKSNGKNGYGGLYCPHWGYTDEAMNTIRLKALSLEYLES